MDRCRLCVYDALVTERWSSAAAISMQRVAGVGNAGGTVGKVPYKTAYGISVRRRHRILHNNFVNDSEPVRNHPGKDCMKQSASARFAINGWDEKPYGEGQDLPKLTRASVTKTYSGDIAGEGQVEYLMMYRSDGSATFVGLERVLGRVGGKAGTFVLQRTGIFEGGQAKESYSVIPGSATGELHGLLGEGTSAVGHGMEHPFTLNYELPQ
jgi:hypothetical protein